MDDYVERYVDEVMDAQVHRSGIFAASLLQRLRRWSTK